MRREDYDAGEGGASGNGHWPDSDATEPSVRVVEAVAAAQRIDPLECPPLYRSVDPEALDGLFTGRTGTSSRVSFEYAGYDVTIDADRRVSLAEPGN